MATTTTTIDAKVVHRLQDAASKLGSLTAGNSPQRLEAIASARAEYERSYPLEKVVQIAGAGAFDYAVSATNFPGFVDGWSDFLRIVYPYTAADQNMSALDEADYGLVRLPSGLFLRFANATPAATELFLAWYSAQHTLSASTSTIPVSDDDALADLAACYACEMLAGYYTQASDPTQQADTVDRRSQGDQYRSQAKRWRDAYNAKMALLTTQRAAMAIADLNPPASMGRGERLLFHD
jgi:hypothetical protein